MQSINVRAVTPALMTVLFGTAVAGIAVAIWTLTAAGGQPVGWVLAGSIVYLLGIPGVTMAFNVPLNNRLDRLDPAAPEAATVWDEYVTKWTRWNHIRVVTGLVAAVAFIIALTF